MYTYIRLGVLCGSFLCVGRYSGCERLHFVCASELPFLPAGAPHIFEKGAGAATWLPGGVSHSLRRALPSPTNSS
jgi:hypothetical protein